MSSEPKADPDPSTATTPTHESNVAPSGDDWKAGRAEWMIIIVLAFVSLMVSIDATILVTALPSLARALNGTAVDTFWTGTSYLLTEAVFQPFVVALSDVFGRRNIYLLSLAFFTVGTLICCLANNFREMLAGRSIQGIGGSGLLSLGLVIVTDIVPLRQRPTYVGINQLSWALGTILGPLLGGVFVDRSTWRWIFYINFPFCAIGFLTVPLVMRLRAERLSLKHRLLNMDWLGGVLFIGSSCSFLIGVSWGGTQYAWSSWRTLLPIIVGIVGAGCTIVWEAYGTSAPFLRLELLKGRSAAMAYTGAVLQGLLMFCELYYIPLYLESVKGFGAILTGVALMPLIGALLPVSVIVGRLMTRWGRYRWAVWSGWAVTCAGTGTLILLDPDIPTYGWVLIFILVGIGHGLILMSLNFAIQAMAETRNVAYAAAMYTFFRTFGMSIGVAIGGAVFQNMLQVHLADRGLPEAVAHDAEGFVTVLNTMPESSSEYQRYVESYSEGFKNVFELLTAVAGVAGLMSLLIKGFTMDKALDTDHQLVVTRDESGRSLAQD
ncbi:Efflux pump FUS6 [Lasiodiplodia theobromae]|uniref:Efflux pump FUS6 n=1 Tax=Lasiodiplodia theobromae TaxID=45133 RepID=A0A5N5CZ92_9PEZI|nr:Efflux pump FUS6 [Lasiodiplodia theobromae]